MGKEKVVDIPVSGLEVEVLDMAKVLVRIRNCIRAKDGELDAKETMYKVFTDLEKAHNSLDRYFSKCESWSNMYGVATNDGIQRIIGYSFDMSPKETHLVEFWKVQPITFGRVG